MDRRRAAGALLALAACIACSAAAPTASNQTALDLYEGAPEGCYYNFQHYGEGDRIMTNEPCLNCTCHNRMLMCYLRVCPFTKAIGQDCTVEKRADQCCPIVTCPDVPVDLLTSTSTTSPAEYGATGLGKLDKYGCSINGKYFPEGSKVPPTPNKPCEHCYCIRNMTTCVMQECTLHVDGCTPIYHKDVCCPVRYSCDHAEDEVPLLDDMSTTVRPTPGFLLTTTTISPVTQMSQDCVHDDQVFADGALIKTEKACEHCYCMKGDIVCVVQECGAPMENEGKNCTSLPPREGQCCPDTYICEGDELTTDLPTESTTESIIEKLTTLSPPRRTSVEGSGYRNEPDEAPYTEMPIIEPEVEGSGEEQETSKPLGPDEIIHGSEDGDQYIYVTTKAPTFEEHDKTTAEIDKNMIPDIEEETGEPHVYLSTTKAPVSEEVDKPTTSGIREGDILEPHVYVSTTTAPESYESVTTELGESLNTVPDEIPDEKISKPYDSAPSTTISPSAESEDVKPTSSEKDVTTSSQQETSEPESSTPSTLDEIKKDTDTPAEISNVTPEVITEKEYSDGDFTRTTSATSIEESEIPADKLEQLAPSTTSSPLEESEKLTTEPDHAQNTVAVAEEESSHPDSHILTTTIKSLVEGESTTELDVEKDIVTDSNEDVLTPHGHITTAAPTLEETEPDRGLNTIPSEINEETSSEPSLPERTTLSEEAKGTEPSDALQTQGADIKPTTVSEITTLLPDSIVTKGEQYTITTEPSFRKEDESIVSTEKPKEIEPTTVRSEFVDEGLIPTSSHDEKIGTSSDVPSTEEEFTTIVPEYVTEIEETVGLKQTTTESAKESSVVTESLLEKVSEPSSEPDVDLSPSTEKASEVTPFVQGNVETDEEPSRIPGEGDCLLNGITYRNNTVVPSKNNCHTGCRCASSIIKCDPIICSPPPDYMDNCQPIYDPLDSCCPTYVCDHPRETVPPQSENQMSGTESPVPSPTIECRGDQCEIIEPTKQPTEPSELCTSGSCLTAADHKPEIECGSEGCGDLSQKPDSSLPSVEQTEKCTDGKCQLPQSQGQVSPVKPCEGEHCEEIDEVKPESPQLCKNEEDCKTMEIPTVQATPCEGESCNKIDCEDGCDTDVIASPPNDQLESCKDEGGCKPVLDCTGNEPCRRKEISASDEKLPTACEGANCIHEMETTVAQGIVDLSTELPKTEQTPSKEVTVLAEVEKATELPDSHISKPNDEKDIQKTDTYTTESHTEAAITDANIQEEKPSVIEEEATKQPTMLEEKGTETPALIDEEDKGIPSAEGEITEKPTVTEIEGTETPDVIEDGTETAMLGGEGEGPMIVKGTEEPTLIDDEGENKPISDEKEGMKKPFIEIESTELPTIVSEKDTTKPAIIDEAAKEKPIVIDEEITKKPTEVEEDGGVTPVISKEEATTMPGSTEKESSDKPTITGEKTTDAPAITDKESTDIPATVADVDTEKPSLIDEEDKDKSVVIEKDYTEKPAVAEDGTEKPVVVGEEEKDKPTDVYVKETDKPATIDDKDKEEPIEEIITDKPVLIEREGTDKPVDEEKATVNPDVIVEAITGKPVVTDEEGTDKPTSGEEEITEKITDVKETDMVNEDGEKKPAMIDEDGKEKPTFIDEEGTEKPLAEDNKPAVFEHKDTEKPTTMDKEGAEKPLIQEDGKKEPEVIEQESTEKTVTDEVGQETPKIEEADHEKPVVVTEISTENPILVDEEKSSESPAIIIDEGTEEPSIFDKDTEKPALIAEDDKGKPVLVEIETTKAPTVIERESTELPVMVGEEYTVQPVIDDEKAKEKPVIKDEEGIKIPAIVKEEDTIKPFVTEEETTAVPHITEDKDTAKPAIIDESTEEPTTIVKEDTTKPAFIEREGTELPAINEEVDTEKTVVIGEEAEQKPDLADQESTKKPAIVKEGTDKPGIDEKEGILKPVVTGEEGVTEGSSDKLGITEEEGTEGPAIFEKEDTEMPAVVGDGTEKPVFIDEEGEMKPVDEEDTKKPVDEDTKKPVDKDTKKPVEEKDQEKPVVDKVDVKDKPSIIDVEVTDKPAVNELESTEGPKTHEEEGSGTEIPMAPHTTEPENEVKLPEIIIESTEAILTEIEKTTKTPIYESQTTVTEDVGHAYTTESNAVEPIDVSTSQQESMPSETPDIKVTEPTDGESKIPVILDHSLKPETTTESLLEQELTTMTIVPKQEKVTTTEQHVEVTTPKLDTTDIKEEGSTEEQNLTDEAALSTKAPEFLETSEPVEKTTEPGSISEHEEVFTDISEIESPTTKTPEAGPVVIEPQEGLQPENPELPVTSKTEEESTTKVYKEDTMKPIPESHATEGLPEHGTTERVTEVSEITDEDKPKTVLPELHGTEPGEKTTQLPVDEIKTDHPEIYSSDKEETITETPGYSVTEPVRRFTEIEDPSVTGQEDIATGYPYASTEYHVPSATEKIDESADAETASSEEPLLTDTDTSPEIPKESLESDNLVTKTPEQQPETEKDKPTDELESLATEKPISVPIKDVTSYEEKTTIIPELSDQKHKGTKPPEGYTKQQEPGTEIPQDHVTATDDNTKGTETFITEQHVTEPQETSTKSVEHDVTEVQKITTDIPRISEKEDEAETKSPELHTSTTVVQKLTTELPTATEDVQTELTGVQITTEVPQSLVTEQKESLGEQTTASSIPKEESSIKPEITTQFEEISKAPELHEGQEDTKTETPVYIAESVEVTTKETEQDIKITPISEEAVTEKQDTTLRESPAVTEEIEQMEVTKSTEPTSPQTESSETTPYLIELEEHTHKIVEDITTMLPSDEHSFKPVEDISLSAPSEEEHSYKPVDDISTSSPSAEEYTPKIDEHPSTVSPYGEKFTTVHPEDGQEPQVSELTTKLTDEVIETATKEAETSSKPSEESLPEDVSEKISESAPVEETTAAVVQGEDNKYAHDHKEFTTFAPTQIIEETTPAAVAESDKLPISESDMVVPTEKEISTSEKPLHPIVSPETTAAEEEFIFSTTKATTERQEEDIVPPESEDKIAKPEEKPTETSEIPPSSTTEISKPSVSDSQPTDEIPVPEEDGHFPPSGTSGYGEPDYVEEDQAFGPGTCRYGGKVYVSAQQIPRDDPCDFCFCFRSDIICLQQSCPPPIHGCHEEPIQGFCCPRYECPVSMATTVNVTTTTTTTTTTLPPHFPTHSYKGAAHRRGCQIKGHTYKVGEVVRSSSGPCLHCTCGGDGQMKCDPKACTPEPMLRQMIAAAVSAKRRR